MLNREEGQSIVLIALAMVALLVFAGLAVDVGVIYSGSVSLARAVDAAVLAGVVELPHEDGTANADDRANQFLLANGVVVDSFVSRRSSGPMGSHVYAITVTHQVNLYFLPLVGRDYVRLPDSAVAEYDPQISLYASQTGKYGQEQTVNLAVFGPDSCTTFGDAYSPSDSQWWGELQGVYHFRLDIPPDYEEQAMGLTETWNDGDVNDVLRVEIWDPDCYNAPGDEVEAVHPDTGEILTLACEGDDQYRHQPCTPRISEYHFAFLRIDENRRGRSAGGCSSAISYRADWNTTTQYRLYYYRRDAGGGLEKRALARYTKGGTDGDHDTDLRWVCPGGSLPGDPTPDAGTFELAALPDDIYVAPDGGRTLFLDVQTLSGASENGFDLWAGPRYPDVPGEVNERNHWIVGHPGGHDSAGATWFGIGHLPMNSNSAESDVLITLAYIPVSMEGGTVVVSAFDNDFELAEALTATIDTLSPSDWQAPVELSGNGTWRHNDIGLPSQPEHVFYGGYLQVQYRASAAHDTFGWKITAEAAPWLVE